MILGRPRNEDMQLRPIKYPWAYDLYNQAVANTWFPHEIALGEDLDDWKKKIEELLENENLRKRMGLAGRKFSQRFSWNKTVEKQLVIYKNLLEKI